MRVVHLSGALLLGCVLVAQAAEDDWQLVHRAAVAGRQQPLSGTYLHQMNGTLETFRIVRGGSGDAVMEKRESLDGPSREIVRNGNSLVCYAPDNRALMAAKVSAMRLFPAVLPEDSVDLAQSYTVKRTGTDRVALRDCNWLDLKPKDRLRYSMRLCVDPATALPLKVITVNTRGETVEQFTFAEIDLAAPRDKSAFRPMFKKSYVLRSDAVPQMQTDTAASSEVSGMPQGFRLLRAVQRSLPGQSGKVVKHMVFSDGLVMLSLFVEPPVDGHPEKTTNLHGAVNMATAPLGDYQVTLVGDMPESSMQTMIKGLHVSLKP